MSGTNIPNSFVIARDSVAGALDGAVAAIGNFDGVHRGHRAVIATACARAKQAGRPCAVLTFTPHPREFFRPAEPLFRLTDDRNKLRLLAATGIDGAILLTFNAALAATSAEDFIRVILMERLRLSGAVIGFDFHFGKGRAGSPDFLKEQGAVLGLSVDVVPALQDEGRPVSSGAVRTALAAGKVVEAAELLGGPWFVSGEVIHGAKRGRELGFPTANIALPPSCGLKHGIYAVNVAVGGKIYGGVASFGTRPQFDNGAPLLEIFVFDFSGDLYGQMLDVAFIGWIRGEAKFESVAALKQQMDEDVRQARDILARTGAAFPMLGQI